MNKILNFLSLGNCIHSTWIFFFANSLNSDILNPIFKENFLDASAVRGEKKNLLICSTSFALYQSYESQVLWSFSLHQFGQMKNGLVFVGLPCMSSKTWKQCSKLDFNPELSSQFKMCFHPKNWKSERNNQWFKPWVIILLQPLQPIVATRG